MSFTGPEVFEAEVGSYEPRNPFQTGLDVLENSPGTMQTIGTTGFRGGNTILRGGWGDQAGFGRLTKRSITRGKGAPKVGGAIRNNNPLTPRTWTRYGSQDMFFTGGGKGEPYTPFNFLSKGGNFLSRHGVFGTSLQKAAGGVEGVEAAAGGAFAPGFISQMNAAERVGRGGRVAARSQEGLASYFSKAQMNVAPELMADPLSARTATYASVQGAATSQMAGYMAALRDPNAVGTAGKIFGKNAAEIGETGFGRGAALATEHLGLGGRVAGEYGGIKGLGTGLKTAWGKGVAGAAEKAGAEVAGKAATKIAATKAGAWAATRFGAASAALATGPAMPFIEGALLVMTAFDVAKMVGAGIAGAPRMAADAARSFTGGLNRQGFGVPYRTNELAVTSRQRGVMAIQNSRLNARSVIGSEASGMAGYFG